MDQQPDSGAPRLSFVRDRKLQLLVLSVLVISYLVLPMGSHSRATAPAKAAAAPATSTSTARLIYAGWHDAHNPSLLPTTNFVRDNKTFLETQPFDGLAIYLRRDEANPVGQFNVTWNTMSTTPVPAATAATVMEPIPTPANFGRLKHNFGLILGTNAPDLFESWSIPIDNLKTVAQAAKNAGLKGLIFDNEDYTPGPFWGDFDPDSFEDGVPLMNGHSQAAYFEQARQVGRDVMSAMLVVFPDIVILTLHGPYVSVPNGWDQGPGNELPREYFDDFDISNELQGAFFVGMMEVVGGNARNIDGGETYGLRSEDDFKTAADWRRVDMAKPNVCAFIPSNSPLRQEDAEGRTLWEQRTSISFGVYDLPWWGRPMDDTILKLTLERALSKADHYVWLYTESKSFLVPPSDPFGRGAAQLWINAVQNARDAVGLVYENASPAPLAAPANLTGSAVSTTVVSLAWDDMSTDETGFKIERKVSGGSWSQIGTVLAGVETYPNDSGLTAGTTYLYRVRAYKLAGDSYFSNESTVTTPATIGSPAAPSNLDSPGTWTSSTVTLKWTDNSTNESGFSIELQSGGTWSEVGSVAANNSKFTMTDLSAITTYNFRVKAFNGYGPSAPSNTETVTTPPRAMVAAAPHNLTVVSVTSSTVTLSWTDGSFSEDGFSIELLDGGTWSETGSVGQDTTTFTKTGLAASTSYTFRVVPFNEFGNSDPTNQVTATTSAASGIPAAPSNLTVTGVSEMTASLSWTDNSSNETGFSIERLQNGAWSQYDWRSANVTTFTAGGLPPSTAFTFRVRAYSGSGSSAPSNEVTATTTASSGPPSAPTNLTVNTVTEMMITISWTDNSSNESEFIIERQVDGNWSQYDWRSANITTFTTGGLPPNTSRTFRVVAHNTSGNSAPSNTVTATTTGGSGVPAAPSSLSATTVTSSSVTLSWIDNSSNENGFSIERLKAGGVWSQTGWVPANTTTFTKAGLSASTEYSFRVLAFNGTGNSPTTSVVNVTTLAPPPPPAAPTNLALTYSTTSTLSVAWTDNSNNEDGFSIQKIVSGNWVEIGSVPANTTTFTKYGLPSGTWFTYRVVSFNGGGSGSSAVLDAQTRASGSPASPTNLMVNSVTSSSVTLSWLDNSTNENGFNVEKLVGGTWQFLATVTTGSSYTAIGLSPNTTYSFRVYAFNGPGNSWYTNVVSPTTSN